MIFKIIVVLFVLLVGIVDATVRPVQIHWEVFWVVILSAMLGLGSDGDESISIPVFAAGIEITAMMRFL